MKEQKIVEEQKLVLRATLSGMLSMLMKFSSLLLVTLLVFFRVRGYQHQLLEAYEVTYISALTQIFDTEMELIEYGVLILSYLVSIALFFLILYFLYRILALLFNLSSTTVIDFQQGRILQKSLRFPFQRIEDENKFHKLIQVRIEQSLIDGLAQSGTLYVEYLVQSQLDSQLRVLVIPFLKDPDRVKRRLFSH